jgi:signal transduction histidine kinase
MTARRPGFSFNLRLRLLTSYMVLILVTLSVIALALIILIGNRAAPPEPTYERLAALTQGLNYIDFIADIPTDPNRRLLQDQVHELLGVFSRTRNVRTLHVRLTQDRTTVRYDSAQRYKPGEFIRLHRDKYKSEQLANVLSRGSNQFFGRFHDPDGREWLYGGVVFSQQRFFTERASHEDLWILSEPRPTVSLQETLAVFSSALAPPLLQAGIAGFAFAIVLAAVISRNIAEPLQRVAKAATAVARGDYSAQVPVNGPPEVCSLAESFNQMTAEVLAANIAQRDFLSNVSHDLKTPLTSIQGYAQAIIDGAAEDTGEAAEIIYEEAGRLNRMVVELTDLERLGAGKLSMASDPIDMAQLSEAVAQSLIVVAEKRQINLGSSIEPVPMIIGDGDRLAQVLMNLISNALKYTPAGGSVRMTVGRAGAGVAVSIKDSGIGIPREELSRVFERFYQVDKARGPQRGTGLGLAIAREIVEAHAGRITVMSLGQDRGAEFRVWLPVG